MELHNILEAYKAECTVETLRRQKVDVSSLQNFLLTIGIQANNMFSNLEEWHVVTADSLEKFEQWLLNHGYALRSIKVRISTLKVYCRLATEAKVLSEDELRRIEKVRNAYKFEPTSLDGKRKKTRIGIKKEKAVLISTTQAEMLKKQDNGTLQGYRDALLMCLLLDQGLRISEISGIRMNNLDRDKGTLTVRSIKLTEEKEHQHLLSEDTKKAIEQYLQHVSPQEFLLFSVHRSGKNREGMTGRAINERVRLLGEKFGLNTLSPEDCRHYWDTFIRPHTQYIDE